MILLLGAGIDSFIFNQEVPIRDKKKLRMTIFCTIMIVVFLLEEGFVSIYKQKNIFRREIICVLLCYLV